jgi:hypothetical protein
VGRAAKTRGPHNRDHVFVRVLWLRGQSPPCNTPERGRSRYISADIPAKVKKSAMRPLPTYFIWKVLVETSTYCRLIAAAVMPQLSPDPIRFFGILMALPASPLAKEMDTDPTSTTEKQSLYQIEYIFFGWQGSSLS